MQNTHKLSFFTLLLMISFASINAVMFTSGLPDIAKFFSISIDYTQQTITWFLIGYAFGQLLYGPLANRYGRKPALYLGIGLQIISSLICIFAGVFHHYYLLVVGRFLLALGSGVGLKMTFTLVNECYEPAIASQKISYLMLAFAITPALAVAVGSMLTVHYGWVSCFYAGALYGAILLFCTWRLPETSHRLNLDALKIKHLLHAYIAQFKNKQLIAGGILMGGATSFIYVFAATAPFIAINLLNMNSVEYGVANLLPAIGLIIGSLWSAQLAKKMLLQTIICRGLFIVTCSIFLMIAAIIMHLSALYILFIPMIGIYFGIALIVANASTVAMSNVEDKAHGSAVMNFINMGIATFAVLSLGFFSTNKLTLPIVYLVLCFTMIAIYLFAVKVYEPIRQQHAMQ